MAMKFALLTLLCFGAAIAKIEEWDWLNSVSPNRQVQDQAFRPGREYHFFYNGQLTTGIAGASKQHSANRIQAVVSVAIQSQTNVILRLQNVRLGKLNRQIPNPRKIMPFDAFEDTPIEGHLKQKLQTPLKFSYTNGMVRDVEFDSREEPWSANVKRGVLNLLQVNLQQHRRIETPEESTLTNSAGGRRNGNNNEQDGQPTFYRVMEETLEGECETLYTIQQQPNQQRQQHGQQQQQQQQRERRSSNNSPVLNVTKSINFEKCNKRPQIKYNFRFATKCESCDPKYENEEKFLKTSTVVQYNITGDKNSFLIDSARTESQYVFTPFDEQSNVIVTYVNQTLVLVKSGPVSSNLEQPQNPIKSDSNMIFTLDWDIALEKHSMHGGQSQNRQLQSGHGNGEPVNKPQIAKKLIQKMAVQMKEQVDEELPRLFSRLVNWLRQCDQQELEQLAHLQQPGQLSPEEEKKIKNIIPQALGACGTKECVKVLVQKTTQGQIHPLRAVGALKGLLHTRVSSKDIVTEVIQLAESEKAREFEPLKRAAWLMAGSLINALCAENEDQLALEAKEDAKKLCGRELKDTYVKLLFNKLRNSQNWQDKVMMLKTIGNAGLDLSIFELEKIIRQQDSQNQPMYVRLEAILALRELNDEMPKKIQRVLMPVALDRREYPSIRSVATYMLFQTQPERPILDQLARNLINEPSKQVAAFVYAKLNSYANSTNPCEQQLATDCKLALRQAKRVNSGLGYSQFSRLSAHNQEQNIGLDLDTGAIYSNVSAIPRHVGAALHVNGLGQWQKYLAVLSLYNEGLEPLVRDYFNERGVFSNSNSFLPNSLTDNLQRHPRNVRNQNQNSGESQNQRGQNQNQNGNSGENENQNQNQNQRGRNQNGNWWENENQQNQDQDQNEYGQELDDIFSKHLKIKHRQYNDEYENDPKAYFSAMFKSQTLAVLPMTKEYLQQLFSETPSKLSDLIPKLQRGLPFDFSTVAQLHDMQLKVPTTIGFPLSITLEAPMALSIRGKVQADLESFKSKQVKVQVDLKPSAVATFQCQVEAWSPVSSTGVKLVAKAKMFTPVEAKLEIQWGSSNPQIKVNIKPPTQKRDLLVLESRPITYTRSWQQYLRNPSDDSHTDEQTIVGEEVNRVSTFNKCYGRQTIGVDMCVRGHVQNTPSLLHSTGTPASLFAGQNKIVFTCQPSESNQDIQIKINSQVQKLNGQEIHKPSFNILGNNQQQNGDENDSSSSSEETSQQQDQDQQQQQQHQTSTEQRRHNQRHPQQQQQQSQSQQRQWQQQSQEQQSQSPRNQQQSQQRHQNQQSQRNQQSRGQQGQGRPNQQDPYQQSRNYEMKNGYKTQVNVELQTGSSTKVQMELSHLYDSRQRYSKLNMKLHRQHPDSYQICLDSEMMFPEQPENIKDVKDKKILAHAQLRWGPNCAQQNYVQITTQAERSRQQIQWEREQSEYKNYNNRENCQNQKGSCSPLTQEDFVEKIGQMLKYRMDINYQNVPPSVQNATNKVYRALKNYYYWQTDVDQINVQNPHGKIRAEFVLDAQTKQRVNVTIKTPKENINIQDLPLSQPLMAMNQKQPFREQFNDYVNQNQNQDQNDDQAECSITGKSGWQRRSQVETFDGTKFSAPFSDCWVVLSKDCGSQKPEFVVMARKSTKSGNNGDLKEVKIVTRQHRIELTPDSDDYNTVQVKVNGKSYDPENEQDIVSHGHTVASIDKEGQSINVNLPETGVEVEFDGYAVNVKLSQYYQGQQCGLCGNFDKESTDEFRNPDNTQEQDLRQYYMNYLIKDGRCQAPQLNEVCQNEDCDQDKSGSSSSSSSSDEDDNDNDDTTEKPDQKTKVIEMDDQICFSTIPVPQCDDNAYPTEIKERKPVPYTCIDQDSAEAEEYERKARFGKKAVHGLSSRQPNFTRTENMPEKCKKYKS